MADQVSPHPDEEDVHLRVEFNDLRIDFIACLTAALLFVQVYPDAVSVIPDKATGLRRLPNECLYLEP